MTYVCVSKPVESALRFSDCIEISVIVEWADNCLPYDHVSEEGHSKNAIFRDFTKPKSLLQA